MRPISLQEWMNFNHTTPRVPDGSWNTMMKRVADFHNKHDFSDPENNGHDMGYRISLTVEELGELSAAITKAKPLADAGDELADLLILILGHSLAMEVDLEQHFHSKMDKIMKRESKMGKLGIRVTEYSDE